MKNYIRDALRFLTASPAQPVGRGAAAKVLTKDAAPEVWTIDSLENHLRFLVAFAGDLRQCAAADHSGSDLILDLAMIEARAATALGRVTRRGAHVPRFVGFTGVIDDAELTAGNAA